MSLNPLKSSTEEKKSFSIERMSLNSQVQEKEKTLLNRRPRMYRNTVQGKRRSPISVEPISLSSFGFLNSPKNGKLKNPFEKITGNASEEN